LFSGLGGLYHSAGLLQGFAIGCGHPGAAGATHGEAHNRRYAPWHKPKLPWSPWPCAENGVAGRTARVCSYGKAPDELGEQPRSGMIALGPQRGNPTSAAQAIERARPQR
jgi:hypothetical protein